jgi:uncharacterized protein YjbI with pentapeptide repeats
VIRSLVVAAFVLLVCAPVAPAVAQESLSRQLIDACVGCRLPHDLHGRDLHGLRFVGSDLRDVDFSHANLSGAEFTGANLDGTRFDDADLRNARFVGVHMRRTSFARANTTGVSFVGASVSQSEIDGASGRIIIRDCTGCSFKGLDLHDADLRGIKIIGASLSDAKLAGARLNDAKLIGISAHGADLSRADLRGANLVGASLRDAKLTGATIGDAVLCTPNHDGYYNTDDNRRTVCTDLRGVDLHGLDFRAARWCSNDGDERPRTCRTVTRQELTDYAHADLTGAQAPA